MAIRHGEHGWGSGELFFPEKLCNLCSEMTSVRPEEASPNDSHR